MLRDAGAPYAKWLAPEVASTRSELPDFLTTLPRPRFATDARPMDPTPGIMFEPS